MKIVETVPLVDAPPPPGHFPVKALLLDIAERGLIFAIYGQFVVRLLHIAIDSLNIGSVLLIMSESVPLFFLLFRRFTTQVSRDPFDWSVAIVGTTMPLLVLPDPTGAPLLPAIVCDGIITLGLCIQIAAKVSLGRSFGIVAANRGVESTGPYRFVRHPMYLGYTMTHIGFLLMMPSVLNAILYGLAFFLQVVRMLREENVLIQDPAYKAFADHVRYRLLPGVF